MEILSSGLVARLDHLRHHRGEGPDLAGDGGGEAVELGPSQHPLAQDVLHALEEGRPVAERGDDHAMRLVVRGLGAPDVVVPRVRGEGLHRRVDEHGRVPRRRVVTRYHDLGCIHPACVRCDVFQAEQLAVLHEPQPLHEVDVDRHDVLLPEVDQVVHCLGAGGRGLRQANRVVHVEVLLAKRLERPDGLVRRVAEGVNVGKDPSGRERRVLAGVVREQRLHCLLALLRLLFLAAQ
eukprot:335694-Hanusia_phi.AAC.16